MIREPLSLAVNRRAKRVGGGSGGLPGVNPHLCEDLLCRLGGTLIKSLCPSCLGSRGDSRAFVLALLGGVSGVMQVTCLEQYGYVMAAQEILGGS